MKIIRNWKQTLTAYSTWALGVIVTLPALWVELPPELKALIPTDKLAVVTAVVAAAGFIGRFVDQGHGDGNDQQP